MGMAAGSSRCKVKGSGRVQVLPIVTVVFVICDYRFRAKKEKSGGRELWYWLWIPGYMESKFFHFDT